MAILAGTGSANDAIVTERDDFNTDGSTNASPATMNSELQFILNNFKVIKEKLTILEGLKGKNISFSGNILGHPVIHAGPFSASLPAGWTAQRLSAGRYRITHNLNKLMRAFPVVEPSEYITTQHGTSFYNQILADEISVQCVNITNSRFDIETLFIKKGGTDFANGDGTGGEIYLGYSGYVGPETPGSNFSKQYVDCNVSFITGDV